MRAWLARLTLFAFTCAPMLWLLLTNPLAWPLLQTGSAGIAARIEAQMDRALSDGMLERRLAEAVAAGDAPTAERLYALAKARHHPLPDALDAEVAALIGAEASWLETGWDCATCANDITSCRSISQIAACALPVELTPFGDLNALRRQGQNLAGGQDVDEVETGLAFLGLTATAALVATGGSSATVKAGATLARTARRIGALTPGFSRLLADAADLPIAWSQLDDLALRRVPLEAVTDTAKLARLGDMARELGRVLDSTSTGEALVLLRHVENGADLSRLARLSEAAGQRTTDAFALLGKSRVFRALDEIGALLRWTIAAAVALGVQGLFGIARILLRRLKRR